MTEVTAERQTARLWEHIKGFHVVHHINIGDKLGLWARLAAAGEDGLTAAELAGEDLHLPYIETWCQTGVAYELMDVDRKGRFWLAPHYDMILAKPGNPWFLTPYCVTVTDYLGADLLHYPEFFRSGGTYTFQEHGEAFSQSIAATTAGLHLVVARRLLPAVPGLKDRLDGGGAVLDMGCGTGGLLTQIARAFPAANCIGVDVDAHGIKLGQANLAKSDFGDRVRLELINGDTIDHAEEFDVVTLFEVLHELPVPIRPQVLANCHRALKPDGVLFIVDETYPANPEELRDPEFGFAVQTAFNELIWGNQVPTRADQDALLTAAGFRETDRQMVGGLFTVITAAKA